MSRSASAVVLLAGLWAVVFLPALLRGHTFPARDVGATCIPWRAEAHRQLVAGHAPLWNPLANGGRLLLANPNAQLGYPSSLLTLVLGPERSVAASIALHHLAFLLGCFVLARRIGTGADAAAVAAAGIGFSGVPLSTVLLPNLQTSLAWGPWALAAALPGDSNCRWVQRALLSGTCLGLSFLGGEPVTTALIALALAVLVIWTQPRGAPLYLAVAGVAAVGVAAPVLLPLLTVYPDTARAALASAPGALGADALAPRRWLELFLPHLLGDFHARTAPAFWAAPSFPWLRYFPALFVGLLPLLLARRAGLGRRAAPWWILAGSGTAGAVLAGVTPAAEALAVPHVRYAIKLLALPVLALPPLVALGWERLAALKTRSRRRKAALAAGLLVPVLLFAVFPSSLARPLLALAFPNSASALAQVPPTTLARRLAMDATALALPLAVLIAAPAAPLAVAAAAGAGGVLATWGLVVGEPASRWATQPQLAEGLSPGIRLATFAPGAEPAATGDGRLAQYFAMRAALVPNYPNRWGLGTVLERGPDGLESARHELLAAAASTLPIEQRVRVAAALGAKVVITLEELIDTPGEHIAGVWRWRPPAAPEAYLARRLHFARGAMAAAVTLGSPVFRPGWDALVEGDGGVRELPAGRLIELPGVPHRRTFQVAAPEGAFLVLQQSHMRCWQADINGVRAPIVTVNGAMMGVWVPAGEQWVRFAVDPIPYRLGLLGPVLVLLALGLSRRGGAWRGHGAPSGESERNSPANPPVQ